MNAILTVSSVLFPLITFPYISRVLLVAGNGKVAFATSVVSYFTMFASLGLPTYGVRACAKVRDDKEKLSQTVQGALDHQRDHYRDHVHCVFCEFICDTGVCGREKTADGNGAQHWSDFHRCTMAL